MEFVALALLYILALLSFRFSPKEQRLLLIIVCCIEAVLVGFRSYDWPDTVVYLEDFIASNDIITFSFQDEIQGYSEFGFHMLGVVAKTFSNNPRVYLIFVSAFTFFILYQVVKKYCIFPIMAMVIYTGRFLLPRHFMQMRSAICIGIILWGLDYAKKRKIWHYMFLVFIAYQFHHMALIAIPFYFIANWDIKNKWIVISLLFVGIASSFLSPLIEQYVDLWGEDLGYRTYTVQEYKDSAKGLLNPMIYYQIILLLLYLYMGKAVQRETDYYIPVRNGYWYATLILIFFNQYSALSGRTSTMFSTLEIIIIPQFLYGIFLFPPSIRGMCRFLYYLGTGICMFYFFYVKYNVYKL